MIGRLLRPVRSGPGGLASNDPRVVAPATLAVTSPAFADGAPLPADFRGLGGISPPLRWSNVPAAARALALIVEDVDVPFPSPLVHAILYGLAAGDGGLTPGAIPKLRPGNAARTVDGALGLGAGLAPGWVPVTPIPGHGPHRYVFTVFALDRALEPFVKPPSKKRLLAAMAAHVIARGATTGTAEA